MSSKVRIVLPQERHRFGESLLFQCGKMFVNGFGGIFETFPLPFDRCENGLGVYVDQSDEKLVGSECLDSQRFKNVGGKITDIIRNNDGCSGMNRGGENMPVVRIGQNRATGGGINSSD